MERDGEEPNYLAGTQLAIDPASFQQVVSEAFLLEHGCQERQEIAAILGNDKSRISQIFSNPKNLKASTIQHLLNHLASREHRQRILVAWLKACFDEDVTKPVIDSLVGKRVSARTVARIDQQIRTQRLPLALRVTLEAIKRSSDKELTEQLYDRAFYLNRRLDRPGGAMAVARTIGERADNDRDYLRVAGAQLMRAQLMLGLPTSKPEDVQPVIDTIAELLQRCKSPSTPPLYIIGSVSRLAELKLNSYLTFIERGFVDADQAELNGLLEAVLRKAKPGAGYRIRFTALQQAARIHLILGDTFQALEFLQKSFESGGLKNVTSLEASGLIQARIMLRTESPDEVSRHLREVIRNCLKTSDLYHGRLAEYELAAIEASMFPPSRPVG